MATSMLSQLDNIAGPSNLNPTSATEPNFEVLDLTSPLMPNRRRSAAAAGFSQDVIDVDSLDEDDIQQPFRRTQRRRFVRAPSAWQFGQDDRVIDLSLSDDDEDDGGVIEIPRRRSPAGTFSLLLDI